MKLMMIADDCQVEEGERLITYQQSLRWLGQRHRELVPPR